MGARAAAWCTAGDKGHPQVSVAQSGGCLVLTQHPWS